MDKNSNPTVWIAPEKLNIAQLALLCRMDRRTVAEKLQQAGVKFEPGIQRGKLYIVSEALPAIYGRVSKDHLDMIEETEEEKLLLLKAKREKAQVELKVKLKELVPIDSVLAEISTEYSFLRAKLRSIPSGISKVLALNHEPAEVFSILSKAIDDALSELKADAETYLQDIPSDVESESNEDEDLEDE